jgi:hypothetical protein
MSDEKAYDQNKCYTCGETQRFAVGTADVTVGYEESDRDGTPIIEKWEMMTCLRCGSMRVLSRKSNY